MPSVLGRINLQVSVPVRIDYEWSTDDLFTQTLDFGWLARAGKSPVINNIVLLEPELVKEVQSQVRQIMTTPWIPDVVDIMANLSGPL